MDYEQDIYRKAIMDNPRESMYVANPDADFTTTTEKKDDGGWGDFMKQGASMFGGGQPSDGGMARPAFGSGNTVQSGGFGKYRGALMSFI
jgi:hypothetical protein